jgi:hypothetical protein
VVTAWSPAGSSILGGGRNFRGRELAGGSRSLGCDFEGYTWSLVPSPFLLPRHHDVNFSALSHPCHHDGLKPLKPKSKNKSFLP